MRTEFPKTVKVAAFKRSGGRCEECTAKLFPGNVQYDHVIPDSLGGEPTLANCMALCRGCHDSKTAKTDVPAIALAKRREARHVNATKPKGTWGCGRNTPYKAKIGGGTVLR